MLQHHLLWDWQISCGLPCLNCTYINAPVPLCRIYCRTRMNIKSKKFASILLCLKGQIHKVIFKNYKNSMNTTQFYLVFHMNEQEWTELSKKIVQICRNQHEYLLCGTVHLHSYCLLVLSHDAPVSPTCTNDLVYRKNNQNTVRI